MEVETRVLYKSPNGDEWRLARDAVSGRVFVQHQANLPSGGRVTDTDIGTFLGAGAGGPEHQELLRLIGTLVENPAPARGPRRARGTPPT